MPLKTKLYLSFIAMIIFSIITAVISFSAFRRTNKLVDHTREDVDHVVMLLLPAYSCWTEISTLFPAAGQSYYSYGFTHRGEDFKTASQYMTELDNTFDRLKRAVDAIPVGKVPARGEALVKAKEAAGAMRGLGDSMREAVGRITQYNAAFAQQVDQAETIVDDMYNAAYEELSEKFDSTTIDPVEVKRLSARVAFASSLFDYIVRCNTAFWKAQNFRGAAAVEQFVITEKQLGELLALVEEYNRPENVREEGTRRQFDSFRDSSKELLAIATKVKDEFAAIDRRTERMHAQSQEVLALCRTATARVEQQVNDRAKSIRTATIHIDDVVSAAERRQLIVLALTLLFGITMAILSTRQIVQPIVQVIERLLRGEKIISNAADNIANASQSLAEASSEQATSLEQTSSALEEMASMSRLTADNADKTNVRTRNTAHLVQEGAEAMRDMEGAMTDINSKAEQISQIIKAIEEIAFQTNLLALNAAVEAARAGEAGKGFAVVADEVRNLAGRSAQSARETTALIQDTVESVRNGTRITERLMESFKGIESGTNGIADLIDQIAKASGEQAQGVDQVNNAVAQMDRVTQQNAASSEETAAASSGLTDQMDDMQRTIGELSHLVFGRQAAKKMSKLASGAPAPRARPALSRAPAPRAPRQAPRAPEQSVMRPDDIIPLDDDF